MITGMLSVIVPVYNASRYLRQCVNSVLAQNISSMEVLLIDDGSTDSSRNICLEYAAATPIVRYLHKENGGVSSARNVGLEHAQGEYVTFVDSDDEVLAGSYPKMIAAFADSDVDLVCCGISHRDESGQESGTFGVLDEPVKLAGVQAMTSCLEHGPVGFTVYAKVFRSSLFLGDVPVRFPEGRLMEEAYILPGIFAACRGIMHVGDAGYAYYNRENSYTTKPLSSECYYIFDTAERYEKLLPKLFPGFNMVHLYRWRVRQATYVYRTALMQRRVVTPEVMHRVKAEFRRVFPSALWALSVSLRMKAMMLDTASRFFLVRNALLAKFHGKKIR